MSEPKAETMKTRITAEIMKPEITAGITKPEIKAEITKSEITAEIMKDVRKLLVIKLDHLGDLLLATPVFRAIKEKYPDVQVDVLINPKAKAIVENNPFIRHTYTYSSIDFDRGNSMVEKNFLDNANAIEAVRAEHYDLAIGLREDLDNVPIQMMCGAKKNIGFRTHTKYAKYFDASAANDDRKHAAVVNFDLLSLIGIRQPSVIQPEVFFKEEDKQWAEHFLKQNHVNANDPIIGFSIGGGWFLNWWPIENFISLGDRIYQEYPDATIILIGGKAEKALEEKFIHSSHAKYVSAVDKTSILQLIALYARMNFVVTNDGGPMHMATAAGTPVIAMFGPSPCARFGPCGKDNVVLTKELPCSPPHASCPQFVKGQLPPCLDNKCMKAITVDEVFAKVQKKLSKRSE